MVHFFLSRAGELNVHFSRCSQLSRFWRKNSHYPLEIQDFEEKNSLLDWMRFCKQILLSRVKISWKKLNFSSNSGEKSYFAVCLCFAERESILKRKFCVVEQYSNFSQQMDFGDSILKHTIFILELDIRTPLCGGDNCSFLGQKKNKTKIGMWMVVGEFLYLVTKSLKSRRLNLLSNHENCLQNFSFSSRN